MNTFDQTVQATSGSAAASTSSTPSGTGSSWPHRHRHLLRVAATAEQRAHLVADRPAGVLGAGAERGHRPGHSRPGQAGSPSGGG